MALIEKRSLTAVISLLHRRSVSNASRTDLRASSFNELIIRSSLIGPCLLLPAPQDYAAKAALGYAILDGARDAAPARFRSACGIHRTRGPRCSRPGLPQAR